MGNKLIDSCYNEIKEAFILNKILIAISSFMFFIPLIIGFIFSSNISSFLQATVDKLSRDVKDGTIQFNFQTIFLNNISIVIREYFIGIFFLIYTSFILIYNGLFVGYYLGTSDNLFKSLVLIIPHGIFEFFSIIIGGVSGFLLGIFILKLIYNIIYPKKDKLSISDRIIFSIEENFIKFKHSLIFFTISCISMLIAVFIEVYFTIYIGDFIFNLFK
ncbi:MAG: stage II sporulation protein M [Methanobacteriaceae archaeon]|jgi:uncharacterized membrane protein SpoIIM required for sporulation|nr:stage II sporulation protein M [Methanobacteriaceae archaeon]